MPADRRFDAVCQSALHVVHCAGAKARRAAPRFEQLGRTHDPVSIERVRNGVLDGRYQRGRVQPVDRVEDIAKRKRMPDEQHALLRTREYGSESARETSRRTRSTVTATRRRLDRGVRRRPGPVGVQRAVRKRAEVDLVELGQSDSRNIAALQRESECLPGPSQLARDAQRYVHRGDQVTEDPRLLDPLWREALARHPARCDPVAVGGGEGVPDEDQRLHGSEEE